MNSRYFTCWPTVAALLLISYIWTSPMAFGQGQPPPQQPPAGNFQPHNPPPPGEDFRAPPGQGFRPPGEFGHPGDGWGGEGHWHHGFPVPIAVFIMVILLSWIKSSSRSRDIAARMDAIKTLADKGQPIPPELLATLNYNDTQAGRHPMRLPVLLFAAGAGLVTNLAFPQLGETGAVAVAFILAAAGFAWFPRR